MEEKKMQVITINLPELYVQGLKILTEAEIFPSRSKAIRQALTKFLEPELKHVQDIKDLLKLMKSG